MICSEFRAWLSHLESDKSTRHSRITCPGCWKDPSLFCRVHQLNSYIMPWWWLFNHSSDLGVWAEVAVRDERSCVLEETRLKPAFLSKRCNWVCTKRAGKGAKIRSHVLSARSVYPRLWIGAVKRGNQTLSNCDCLCGKHFGENSQILVVVRLFVLFRHECRKTVKFSTLPQTTFRTINWPSDSSNLLKL